MSKEEKLVNPLLQKKVTLSIIERKASSIYKDDSMSTLAVGAAKSFVVPMDQNGNLKNPLSPSEQAYFEDLLGLDLSPYKRSTKDNPRANFWARQKGTRIVLRKKTPNLASADKILDLSDPYDFIAWKIALLSPRVANTWQEKNETLEYEFVLKDGEVKLEDELKFTDMEDVVSEYLLKNKTSKKKLFDLLRLYGVSNIIKQASFNSSTEWLYNELRKIARRKKDLEKLYNLLKLGEKDVYMKVLLADAVTIGLVDKRPYEYRMKDGERIGGTEVEAISYLEDPKNQSTKAAFEIQILEFYKTK